MREEDITTRGIRPNLLTEIKADKREEWDRYNPTSTEDPRQPILPLGEGDKRFSSKVARNTYLLQGQF